MIFDKLDFKCRLAGRSAWLARDARLVGGRKDVVHHGQEKGAGTFASPGET